MAHETISGSSGTSYNALSLSLVFVGTASHPQEELTQGQCLLLGDCAQLESLLSPLLTRTSKGSCSLEDQL